MYAGPISHSKRGWSPTLMLILSRRPGQQIVIPSLGVTIHLARIQGQTARIGIDAPLDADVFRSELLEGEAPAPPRRCRALVVDDDQNERTLLAGLLSMYGCECDVAADGQDALDFLAQAKRLPDYVLLDNWMPRRDGKQTLDAIRAEPRYQDVKVFSISSTPPEEVGMARGPGGIDAWFPKPLDPRRLWEALRIRPAGDVDVRS
jgi:carbon storage regulator CsrA